jgi:hypothetical protein
MFVENQNYADSLLFLGSARIALANIVKESTVKNKKQLVSYIYNEASDYEIMHLLVRGGMPDEKFNHVDEAELWMEFKIQILGNRKTVQEMVSNEIFTNVLTEVDSIYPLQSAESLFEYSLRMIQEQEYLGEFSWAKVVDFIKQGGTASQVKDMVKGSKEGAAALAKKAAGAGGLKKLVKDIQAGGKQMGAGLKQAGKEVGQTVAGSEVGKGVAAMGKGFKQAGKEVAGAVGGAIKKGKQAIAKKDLEIQRAAQSPAKRAAGETIAKAQQAGMDKGLKGDIAAKGAGERAAATRQAAQQAGQKVDLALKGDIAKSRPTPEPEAATGLMATIRQKIDSARQLASQYAPKLQKFAKSPTGLAIGGAALGALAIYGATKTYKRFFSKAAKACAGMSGGDKTRCMNRYKVQGLQAQIKDLQGGASVCQKSKNPDKCQGVITQKMASLQKKIGKLQKRGA